MKAAGYSFVIAIGIMVFFSGIFGFAARRPIQTFVVPSRTVGTSPSRDVDDGGFGVFQAETPEPPKPPDVDDGGYGVFQAVTPAIGAIHGVEVDGSFTVEVRRGPTSALSLKVPSDVLPYVRHDVKDGVLHLYLKPNPLTDTGTDNMHATVALPNLESLVVDGSGQIAIFDATSADFSVAINGSSEVTASGSANHVSVSIAGSGSFDGGDLHSTEATAAVNGAGEITVDAAQKVEATVVGSGNVHYKGNPHTVSRTVTGSGDVDQED